MELAAVKKKVCDKYITGYVFKKTTSKPGRPLRPNCLDFYINILGQPSYHTKHKTLPS